jgi:hypothetical protein
MGLQVRERGKGSDPNPVGGTGLRGNPMG